MKFSILFFQIFLFSRIHGWSLLPWKWTITEWFDDREGAKQSKTVRSDSDRADEENRPNKNSPTEDFIRYFGFEYEFHMVTTADGFNLAVHRIPQAKNKLFIKF